MYNLCTAKTSGGGSLTLLPSVCTVTTVLFPMMIERWTYITSFRSIRVTRGLVGWFGMNYDLFPRWIKGDCIEVKLSVEKSVCRWFLIGYWWNQYIQCYPWSRRQYHSKMGEFGSNGGNLYFKWIFKSLDSSFCRIGYVNVWWHQVIFCLVLCHGRL